MQPSYNPFETTEWRNGMIWTLHQDKYFVTHRDKKKTLKGIDSITIETSEVTALEQQNVKRVRFIIHTPGKIEIYSSAINTINRCPTRIHRGTEEKIIPIHTMKLEGEGVE